MNISEIVKFWETEADGGYDITDLIEFAKEDIDFLVERIDKLKEEVNRLKNKTGE